MNNLLFIGNLGGGELLIILLVVLIFFGGKKIPELMNGLGKGVRSFKDGMKEVDKTLDTTTEDEKKESKSENDKK